MHIIEYMLVFMQDLLADQYEKFFQALTEGPPNCFRFIKKLSTKTITL